MNDWASCQQLPFQPVNSNLNHSQSETIIYSKHFMDSSPYSVYITHYPLSFYNCSSLSASFQQNPNILPQSPTYPNNLFYSSLPNCFLPQYNLVVASVMTPETPSNSVDFNKLDYWGASYNAYVPSATSLQSFKDSHIQPYQTMPAIKIQEENVQLQGSFFQKLKEKKEKQQKIRKGDRDYLPHRSQKKQVRRRIHQNQNRNVIPNEINQIISFLQKRSKSGAVVERLWEKYPAPQESYTINRFYVYQNILKDKVGHYSNEASLKLLSQLYEPECRIWHQSEQRHYIKLSRMLVSHFLREDSIFIILTSKRMKSQKKLEHLRARRKVACRVLDLFKRY